MPGHYHKICKTVINQFTCCFVGIFTTIGGFLHLFFAGKTLHLMMQNIINEPENILEGYAPKLQQLSAENFF